MKKLITALLILALLGVPVSAAETETEATNPPRDPGYCGESITWNVDRETGVLTISGEGAMDDFPEGAPWAEYSEEILMVTLDGAITYIGANAFADYDNLTEVDFGSAIREIGPRAFYSCDGLTEIWLPQSFKIFGQECFRYCTGLEKIHCTGNFPSFRLNCLWDSWVKIYYPAERPWPVSLIEELEGAFHGRIEFLASDGSDPFHTEQTEETTEETTEATTEATTEPTTEATTAPTTEATTAPTTAPTEQTEPPTQPSTQETVQWTTAPAHPEEAQKPEKSGSWIGLAIVCLVLSGLGIGALVFSRPRGRGSRGKYSR